MPTDNRDPQRWAVVASDLPDAWGIRREGETEGEAIAQMLWQRDAEEIVVLHNRACDKPTPPVVGRPIMIPIEVRLIPCWSWWTALKLRLTGGPQVTERILQEVEGGLRVALPPITVETRIVGP